MPDSATTNYGWTKPENGQSSDSWGLKWNQNADDIDTDLKAVEVGALKKAENLNDLENKGAARSNLGVAIGTHVQGYSAILASLAGSAGSANTTPYFSGANTISLQSTTAFGRSLWNAADATAARSLLSAQKTVTVSTSGPSGGASGDIWVVV